MEGIRTALAWLKKNLGRKEMLCLCLIAGLMVGLFAHGFMFANKIPNHDDLNYYSDLSNAGLHSGRYFLHFFWKLFSDLSTPWLNGILGTLFLCACSFFLCETFEIRKRGLVLAVVLLIQSYPVNVSIYCYMYEAHVFMLGITLAAAAAWLIKCGKGWLRYVLAAGVIVMATGVYQVFVMYAVGLLILLVIREAAVSERKAKQVWGFAISCALTAVAGLVLYLIGLKLIQSVGGIQLNDYQGIDQTGSLSLALIPQKIKDAYQKVWEFYVTDRPDYVSGRMQIFRLPLAVMGAAGLAVAAVKSFLSKKPMHGVLLILCGLLLPMACCGIYFMGDEIDMIHMITMYPLILVLILPAAVVSAEDSDRLTLRNAAALVMVCLYLGYGFQSVMLDNQAYYRHQLSFSRAEHTAERIAMRIEEQPEYRPGAKVYVKGFMNAEESMVFFEYDVASRFLPFVGMRMELDYFWNYCLPNLLSRVIGLPVVGAGDDWEPSAQQEKIIASMPCYPAEGCVAFVDDICVVKLSD